MKHPGLYLGVHGEDLLGRQRKTMEKQRLGLFCPDRFELPGAEHGGHRTVSTW